MRPPIAGNEVLDTHRKALAVNLDKRRYGTFAEIGAGQEVARWFFRVGGAAGTIAKSISAYDMAVSDAIYGHTERYVSRERLQSMLDYEHEKNVKRLSAARGDTTAFFVFANTVAANRRANDSHGWLGLKFQAHPRDAESQIVLHVRMRDRESHLQQEALGVVGVNLLYGAFFLHHEPEQLVESLLDNLSTDRLTIDMIELSGIAFRHVDNRLLSLKLVQLGLSPAAMFGPKGEVLQTTEVLYKKPVLVQRGAFRPVTTLNLDMMRAAGAAYARALARPEGDIADVMEVSMSSLLNDEGKIDARDFLARADVLGAAGKTVMISDYVEYFRLAAYLRGCTREPVAMVLTVRGVLHLLDEQRYPDVEGGLLEAMGRLFARDVRLFVHPARAAAEAPLTTLDNLPVPPGLAHLFAYLRDRGSLVPVEGYDPALLALRPREVLARIQKGDPTWHTMVAPESADLIERRGLFGSPRRG
jgi:hypothetical protein